ALIVILRHVVDAEFDIQRMVDERRAMRADAHELARAAAEPVTADQILRGDALARAIGTLDCGDDALLILLDRDQSGPVADFGRAVRGRNLLQDWIEDHLRTMPLMLGAEGIVLRLAERIHLEAAELIAGEARDEYIVERVIGRKAPIAYALRCANLAQQFHRPDADHQEPREFQPFFRRVALDEQIGDAAPAEFGRQHQPDRAPSSDQHRNFAADALHRDDRLPWLHEAV